jgi:hypothetical protein
VRDWARFWDERAQGRAGARSPWPAEPAAPIGIRLSEEEQLRRRLAALGLTDLAAVRVTDNRAVMVSVTKGRVLRIHRGYARASDRVLRAVVRFLARSTRPALRRAARHEILSFGADVRVERLGALFREANAAHFGGALPELPIRLSGRMKSRLGQLCLEHGTGVPYEITLSRRHVERHGWTEVADTLLHEMVHLWQQVRGHPVDHGRTFGAKAREVGVERAARRQVRRAAPTRRAARTD